MKKLTLKKLANELEKGYGWYSPGMPINAGKAIFHLISKKFVNPNGGILIDFKKGSYPISEFSEGNSRLLIFKSFPILSPYTDEDVISEWKEFTKGFIRVPYLFLENRQFILELRS